jgi:hypothetical protein
MRAATQPWAWAGRATNAKMPLEMAKERSKRLVFIDPPGDF